MDYQGGARWPPGYARVRSSGQPLRVETDAQASVAQWIERRFPKPCVASSILAGGAGQPSGLLQPASEVAGQALGDVPPSTVLYRLCGPIPWCCEHIVSTDALRETQKAERWKRGRAALRTWPRRVRCAPETAYGWSRCGPPDQAMPPVSTPSVPRSRVRSTSAGSTRSSTPPKASPHA